MKQRLLNLLGSHHLPFFVAASMLLVLLFRDPYSTRTMIPNLEPFPDSFHYIDPALSALSGKGFVFEREGRTFPPSVPPAYSVALLPVLALTDDVRSVYLANAVLSFASLFVLALITRKLFDSTLLRLVVLVVYVIQPITYWFPSLAMAENLLLLLFLIAVYLCVLPVTKQRAMLLAVVSVLLYATKYASLPLLIGFPFLYTIKMWVEHATKRQWLWFLTSLAVTGGGYAGYEYLAKGNNMIGGLLSLFVSVITPPKPSTAPADTGGTFFSLSFAGRNIQAYTGWLFGRGITILWKQLPLFSPIITILGTLGLGVSLFFSKTRLIGATLLASLGFVIAFMMVFYAYDGRYFIIAIPTVALGFGLCLRALSTRLAARFRWIAPTIGVCLLLAYAFSQASALKLQVALNLKYAESPWYYTSTTITDAYLRDHRQEFTKTPVVIAAVPPFLYDYYAREPMILLPLHPMQEFRSRKNEVWGNYDYTNLPLVYQQFLQQGHPVFLTEYGLGNEQYLKDAYEHVLASFAHTKVLSGCYDLCDMHQLTMSATLSAQRK